jgi:hypothetical protein
MNDDDRLRLDYEQTAAMYRTLTDIRFRLIALVPTLTAAGVVVLAASKPQVKLAGGLLGGTATFGVILYDLRNTHLYDAMQQRLRALEAMIGFPETVVGSVHKIGGAFLRRPDRSIRYFGVLAAHDYGLGIIYSAAMAGWTWLVLEGLLEFLNKTPSWFPAAGAAVMFAASFALYWRIDHHDLEVFRSIPDNGSDALGG